MKLIDFGLAREGMYTGRFTNSKDGTNGYKAPESFDPISDNLNPSLTTY